MQLFSNAFNAVCSFVSNFFGASSSTVVTTSVREDYKVPHPSPIVVKSGNNVTKTVTKSGNSSKAMSAYVTKNSTHPEKSSAGLKINIEKFTFTVNVSLDNTGICGSWTDGDRTDSFGVRVNLSQLEAGFESSTSVAWDDDTVQTEYANASISFWAIAAAYAIATTGQLPPEPAYTN